eukprot:3909877-Pyramimonas_sp.AAC.1
MPLGVLLDDDFERSLANRPWVDRDSSSRDPIPIPPNRPAEATESAEHRARWPSDVPPPKPRRVEEGIEALFHMGGRGPAPMQGQAPHPKGGGVSRKGR